MNLGEAIIDYRREVLKICTDQEDLKKDIDLLSGKLRKLFSNMNIDIKLFKEGGRKQGSGFFLNQKRKSCFLFLHSYLIRIAWLVWLVVENMKM